MKVSGALSRISIENKEDHDFKEVEEAASDQIESIT